MVLTPGNLPAIPMTATSFELFEPFALRLLYKVVSLSPSTNLERASIVVCWYSLVTGILTLSVFIIAFTTFCAISEVPPISKKLSSTPIPDIFNSFSQISAIRFSTLVRGFLKITSEFDLKYPGSGNFSLSIFPLALVGNSSTHIKKVGTINSGNLFTSSSRMLFISGFSPLACTYATNLVSPSSLVLGNTMVRLILSIALIVDSISPSSIRCPRILT